jgi:signal transduction histidine kinase
VASRQGYALTYRINAADKSERSVLEQGRAVYASDGRVTALEGIILDITDRVEAERERAFLQNKLNRAERVQALGLLAGGVAHDLNNMLAPVMAYPDLILSKLPENDPLRPKLMIIRDAAQQAVDVVQDLLTMARRGRIEMTSVSLNDVVEMYTHSANFLQLTAKHPDVAVVIDLAPHMDSIGGSVTHLNKALMNIVVNAFDAMNRGGQLTIRTRQRNVTELADGHRIIPGEYIILSVSDTGVGIPPEDMKKIFEPYFSRKQMGTSGTGLGLAVVYGTVKDHHGYYDIISQVGEGTEFILYFPAENQSAGIDADGSRVSTLATPKAI